MRLPCFKAYDVRGRLGVDLDAGIVRRIVRALAETLNATCVVLGRDNRLSSPELSEAAAQGFMDAGVTVLDLGLCGTEEVYFATSHHGADAGIMVTASHNPSDYNGLKFIGRGAAPLDPDTTLASVRRLAESGDFLSKVTQGMVIPAANTRTAYVQHVLSFVDVMSLPPLKLLVNAGNGAAGPTLDALANEITRRGGRLTFLRQHHEPDGHFPNGIPNPLLPENQPSTADAIRASGADLGVAWDGDFDRCFLFDHEGRFIPGEYVVGLLADAFLSKEKNSIIVHDPRVIWSTQDVVRRGGGTAVVSRTGHAFLKQKLRETGAVYGGEMSAHHYFREFMSCDSGMIPWLMVVELMGRRQATLATLVADMRAAFPSSGEINFTLTNPQSALAYVEQALAPAAISVDHTDGLSMVFSDWRFNLRCSNTEPVVRLNVEARGSARKMEEGLSKVTTLLRSA